MNSKNIDKFIVHSKKYNQMRLILCVFLLVVSFPAGKFVSKTIQKKSLGNPKYIKIFQPYENLEVTTKKEKELKSKIDTLLGVVKSTIVAIAAGTGFLVFLILVVGSINFIQRYYSDKRYLNIIEELYKKNEDKLK